MGNTECFEVVWMYIAALPLREKCCDWIFWEWLLLSGMVCIWIFQIGETERLRYLEVQVKRCHIFFVFHLVLKQNRDHAPSLWVLSMTAALLCRGVALGATTEGVAALQLGSPEPLHTEKGGSHFLLELISTSAPCEIKSSWWKL